MRAMTGIIILGLALFVCSCEPRRTADQHELLAAGLPSAASNEARSLMVMPTAGGEPRELFRRNEGEPWPQVVEWSHDGHYVYYVLWGYPEEDPSRGLWRVPAEGGEPEHLGWYMEFDVKQIPSFHPYGRRIAFTVSEFGAEVWVMEHFLLSKTTDQSELEQN